MTILSRHTGHLLSCFSETLRACARTDSSRSRPCCVNTVGSAPRAGPPSRGHATDHRPGHRGPVGRGSAGLCRARPGRGYALVPGFRPDAESLGVDEAGALFVAGGAQVATDLGLVTSSPAPCASWPPVCRPPTSTAWAACSTVWSSTPGLGSRAVRTPSALSTVFAAVQADRRLRVSYRSRGAAHGSERRLDPWGLVLAAGTWYPLPVTGAATGPTVSTGSRRSSCSMRPSSGPRGSTSWPCGMSCVRGGGPGRPTRSLCL